MPAKRKTDVSGTSTETSTNQIKLPRRSSSRRSYSKRSKSVIVYMNEANQFEHWVAIPPDGGWGWVIVVIAFISYFMMDGVCYTFGIFLSELAETFDKQTSEVAMISSYLTGTYYLTGPIACALCNKLGFRLVGFVGALMSTGIFAYASFVEDFFIFSILIGFGVGFAFDLLYTVMLLDVGYYFESYRALATAISVLGVSAGIMGFPIIFKDKNLLGNYHWRWKFRFIAGAFAVLAVLTLGLRPIKPTLIIEEAVISDTDSIGSFDDSDEGFFGLRKMLGQFHNVLFPTVADYTEEESTFLAILPELTADDQVSITRSVFDAGVSKYSNIASNRESRAENVRNKNFVENLEGCCTSMCCLSCCRNVECCQRCCYWCQGKCDSCYSVVCCITPDIHRPLYRDDIFYPGSLTYDPEYSLANRNMSIKSVGSAYSKRISYHLSVSRVITQKDIEEERKCVCCPEAVIRVLVTMLDLTLFASKPFTILTISAFLTMVGLYIPFVFMVERGEELKLEGHWPNTLVSIMGMANCLGRIACGMVSFCSWLDAMVVSYLTLIVGGGFVIVSAYWTDLTGQITSAVVYGFCCASFTTLRTVILANMLGLEKLTNAFGITILFYGLASFVGIPAASYIRQTEGSYKYCFVMAGGVVALSGFVLMLVKRRSKPKVQFNV